MNKAHCFLLTLLICSADAVYGIAKPQFISSKLDDTTARIDCTISLEPGEYIYADTIDFSVDNSAITLGKITLPEATSHFDPHYKTTKQVLENNPTISIIMNNMSKNRVNDAFLRLTFYTNKSKTALESLFAIDQWQDAQPQQTIPSVQTEAQEQLESKSSTPQEPDLQQPTALPKESSSWSDTISGLMKASSSIWLKLLFALLLGLLLSLTPCIYPMIPITMGILQAQGTASVGKNFLLALAYTMGIATTFALLGLAASFAGVLIGSMMTHPLVILVIIALLLYIAFSLFGFYELYMPRSLTNNHIGASKTASYLTAFLFGAASGTVASPCLSPGIIFMLTLVATLNNVFLGFILLFSFGIGLGLPLLLIGTFSGSITLLPRAGSWMNEIKYIFGFMMIGMAIYFLTSMLPYFIIIFLLGLLVFIAGCFYLIHTNKWQPGKGKRFYDLLSVLLIASSIVIFMQGVKTYLLSSTPQSPINWAHSLGEAQQEALTSSKHLFIFVHAPLCIACNEVEHLLETSPAFITAAKNVIPVSINLADRSAHIKEFQQKYNILGAPSCLLINPHDGEVIKRWDGELSIEQVQELINSLS